MFFRKPEREQPRRGRKVRRLCNFMLPVGDFCNCREVPAAHTIHSSKHDRPHGFECFASFNV